MTDNTDNPVQTLTTQQRAAIGKSKPGQVTGRLKAALDMMVWEALPYNEAAVKSGITTRSMRLAMNRPHVLAYLRRERGVRLVTGSAKNLARLEELRDQNDNITGAVQAAKALEVMTTDAVGGPGPMPGSRPRAGWLVDLSDERQHPGVTIRIINQVEPPAGHVVDVTPSRQIIEHDDEAEPVFKHPRW